MKIIRIAKKSKALRQSVFMTLGNIFASSIAAIALIIFSRFLGPEKFGVFSIGFSLVLLLSRLVDMGINIAMQKNIAQNFEANPKKAGKFIQESLKLKVVISLIITTLFLVAAKYIATYWLKTEHVIIVQIAAVLALITVGYEFIAVIHQSTQQFSRAILMNITQAIFKTIFAIGIWAFHLADPVVAFTLYVISPLAGALYGLAYLPKWAKQTWSKADPSIQKTILSMVKFTSIAVMAGAIGDNVDVLIVKSFLTEYDTGLYAAGARLGILISIIGYSLGTVLNPRVARYKKISHFGPFVRKAVGISMLALVGIVVIVPLTRFLIIITAGNEYVSATPAIKYLLAAGMVTVATTPFVSMFYVLEKPVYFALSGVVQTVTLIVVNIILIPQFGIVGAGMSKLIMRITTFIFTLVFVNWAVKKEHKKNLFEFFRES